MFSFLVSREFLTNFWLVFESESKCWGIGGHLVDENLEHTLHQLGILNSRALDLVSLKYFKYGLWSMCEKTSWFNLRLEITRHMMPVITTQANHDTNAENFTKKTSTFFWKNSNLMCFFAALKFFVMCESEIQRNEDDPHWKNTQKYQLNDSHHLSFKMWVKLSP